MTNRYPLRALGLSAAIIVGAGGSIAASPAFAAPNTLDPASAEFKTVQKELLDTGAAAVGSDADGDVLVLVEKDSDKADAVFAKAEEFDNTRYIRLTAPIRPAAATDVVGGSGYLVDVGNGLSGLCSFAFPAWTNDGKGAAFTAGHCGEVGQQVSLSDPKTDNEFTGGESDKMPNEKDKYTASKRASFGTFEFSQWGGKTDPYAPPTDQTVTDFAVIKQTNDDLNLQPKVTDWSSQASGDLSTSGTVIRRIDKAEPGEMVRASGRTTGDDGPAKVLGDLVFDVADGEPENGEEPPVRYVRGFMAEHTKRQGDSGGAWYNESGEALGVTSAMAMGMECTSAKLEDCKKGVHDYAFAADLQHGMDQAGDYELMMAVDKPELEDKKAADGVSDGIRPASAPATSKSAASSTKADGAAEAADIELTAKPGQQLTGKTEPNATAEVAEGSPQQPENFKAEAGTYSFTAPQTPGEYNYHLIARKGRFNVSEVLTIKLTVTDAEPTPTPTDDPSTDPTPTDDPSATPTDDPSTDPTDDPSTDPTPTDDPSATPTESNEPTPTATETDAPVERGLTVDPEKITAADFVKKDAVTITATGCTPGSEAELSVNPRGSNVTGHVDTAQVDENGNVSFTVYGENAGTPNAYIGDYDVKVACDGGEALTGSFSVTSGKDDDGKGGDDSDDKDGKGKLPRTGVETLGSIGAAAALIAGGAGLYVLARRRRS